MLFGAVCETGAASTSVGRPQRGQNFSSALSGEPQDSQKRFGFGGEAKASPAGSACGAGAAAGVSSSKSAAETGSAVSFSTGFGWLEQPGVVQPPFFSQQA